MISFDQDLSKNCASHMIQMFLIHVFLSTRKKTHPTTVRNQGQRLQVEALLGVGFEGKTGRKEENRITRNKDL